MSLEVISQRVEQLLPDARGDNALPFEEVWQGLGTDIYLDEVGYLVVVKEVVFLEEFRLHFVGQLPLDGP